MTNVTRLSTITTLDIEPDNILEQAKGKLSEVLVLGWDDNNDIYVASSNADIGRLNLIIDVAKSHILEMLKRQSGL